MTLGKGVTGMKQNPYKRRAKDLENELRSVRDQINEVLGEDDEEDDSDEDNNR